MSRDRWMKGGFWLAIGLAGGMLLSDLTRHPSVKADSSDRYEEYTMVSGASFDKEIDLIWLLDYKFGVLHALVLSRQGQIQALGKVDLVEQLEIEKGNRIKPHFMMVTGRFNTRNTDYCYLAETETGQILCIEPPLTQGARPGQPLVPRVVSRFRFRPDE